MNEAQTPDPSDIQTEDEPRPVSWRERMQWEVAQLRASPVDTMRMWAETAGQNTFAIANAAGHRLVDVSRALLDRPERPSTLSSPITDHLTLSGEVDLSLAQETVEGYMEVVTDLQQRQARLTANDFEAAKEKASSMQAPVNVARGLVNIAREEETIVAHAGGYRLGLQGEPTLRSVTDAYGRVIRLDELGASMQAQEAQGRLEMQARAALIGRTEAAMAAKLSQLYQEQAGQGVANPIVPDLPHDAAVNIVNELWTRAMPSIETNSTGGNQTIDAAEPNANDVGTGDPVSQAGASESTPNVETPVSIESHDSPQETGETAPNSTPENPPQATTATWLERCFSDLGLTFTHDETVRMVLDAEHHRRQYERASAHVNERHEAGDHTPITAIVRGRIEETLTNIPNLVDVRLLGESVDAVAHALQNLQNADPQIRARVGTIFLTRIREMQQNIPASNVSTEGHADPSETFVTAVIAQMEIYSQEESDANRVHAATEEIHRLCQEYVVVDESIGLQEGQNHFESTIYITLPLEETILETNFFVGPHRYLQIGDQVARVTTGYDVSHRPSVWLTFGTYQQDIDPGVSFGDIILNESSRNVGPVEIDSTHSYTWHLERVGDVTTSKDEAGNETTNMNVKIVCDVTESAADSPEDLTEQHDSVIRDPSSATNLHGATFADGPSGSVNTNNVDVSPQEAYFGDQPDEPSPEPPPKEKSPIEEKSIMPELSHPGFERLEPRHAHNFEANEGTPIEEWKEEGIQVGERSVSWGIHPIADQTMPRMWVYDISTGGSAAGDTLDPSGNKNVFEHGDFALVAIAQPSGSEPSRTWNIRAELLHKIPPPPDIATRINNVYERLRLLNDTHPEQMDVASLSSMQVDCDAILEQYEEHTEDGNIDVTQIEHIRNLSSLIGTYIRILHEKESGQHTQLDADKLAHVQNLDSAMQNASQFSPNLVAAGNAEREGNFDDALNLYRQELTLMRLQNDEQKSIGQPPIPGQVERMDLIERGIRRILEPRREAQIQALHAETERLTSGFQEAYARDPASAIDYFVRDVGSNILPATHAIHQINTELRDNLFTRLNLEVSRLFDRVNTILLQNRNPRVIELIDMEIKLLRGLELDTIEPHVISQAIRERELYRENAEDLLKPFDSEHVEDTGVKAALAHVEGLKDRKNTVDYTHALEQLAVTLEATSSRNNKMRAYTIYGDLATTYNRLQDSENASRCFEARNRLEAELFNRVAIAEGDLQDVTRNPLIIEPTVAQQGEKLTQFQQRLDTFLTNVPNALQVPVRQLYELAYDVTNAELAVVRRVGEIAEQSHIPFLGPAFAGFAEFIQGVFTLRDLETGLMTDETRAEARQHFVAWITNSLEGGLDLAGLVSGDGSVLNSIRELLVKGETRNPLLPRLVSLMACQRIMGTSGAENPGITRTIGQIAVGLLQDSQIAEGIDKDLLTDPRFATFIEQLKEYFHQHPPLTSRT